MFVKSPKWWLALAMLCWAGNWIVGRAFHVEIPPAALNFWRWVAASLVILPVAWSTVRRDRTALMRHWRFVVSMSAMGGVVFQTMIYVGLRSTSALNGAVMYSSVPVFIVAVGWLATGERVHLRQSIGIVTSLVGVLVVIAHGDLDLIRGLRFNRGDLWILGAMPVWSLYTILLRRWPPELTRMGFLAAMAVISVVLQAPLYALELASGQHMIVSRASICAIGFIGLFASFLAYVMYNGALAFVTPAIAGVFHHLLPVFIAVLAIFFLGESMNWYQLPAIVLIATGIWLTSTPAEGHVKPSSVGYSPRTGIDRK